MKLIEITGMPKATSEEDLIASIKDGKFTKDGSDLLVHDFFCREKLTSLEGSPREVLGTFDIARNFLTSLKGGPRIVHLDFDCEYNDLKSLEGCPEQMGYFFCKYNQLSSLEGIHKHIKKMNGIFWAEKNPIKSHMLGLLKIPGCNQVQFNNKDVQKILNKYLPLGDLLDCQEELIEAGFEEYAQL